MYHQLLYKEGEEEVMMEKEGKREERAGEEGEEGRKDKWRMEGKIEVWREGRKGGRRGKKSRKEKGRDEGMERGGKKS